MDRPEQVLQIKCVTWLKKRGYSCYKIHNEGRRTPYMAKILRDMGLSPGILDLAIPIPRKDYHGAYIEFKDGSNGTLSDTQKWWCEELKKNGYYVAVIKTYEEFLEAMSYYFDLPL
ncbi:MAG TPA: VRR-NUC domain-containing protein [Candidatus Nitrosopolaris rasttigaisensis]|nr:VRR-NUC domain-containing protein [Candidatus Nitrosopolaris rasttigaisensis]